MNFNPNEVTHINRLEFFHENDDNFNLSFHVVLTFLCQPTKRTPDTKSQPYEVVVKFIEVSGFKFEPMFSDGVGAVQLSGFEIIDINDRQWDSKRYLVEDYEHGQILFYCKEYQVIN